MRNETLEGVVVPLLAPVSDGERLDQEAFEALIERCIAGGADSVFAGGTSGLGPLWPEGEWRRMMAAAVAKVDDRVPLLGGVIASSTAIAVERIRFLEAAGYRHIVVTPTFYLPPERPEEYLRHFEICREATESNLVAYNIPSCTHASIPAEVLGEMAARGWTRCIKESSGDRGYFERVLAAVKGTGAVVLQGFEPDIAWGLRRGAVGIVPVCANFAPGLYAAACRAAATDERERLDALQERIMMVRETLLLGDKHWLVGALYGMHTVGIGTGRMLQPFAAIPAAERDAIEGLTAMLRVEAREGGVAGTGF